MKLILILYLSVVWCVPPRPVTGTPGLADPLPADDVETAGPASGSTAGRQSAEAARKSTISGTVVDQSGQPLANVALYLRGVAPGSEPGTVKTEWSDDNGRFQFSGLLPGVFTIFTRATTHYPDWPDDQRTYLRTGESIKIRMIKGGIITGKVSSMSGEPIIAAAVTPTRVRDQEGKTLSGGFGFREFTTDDRGVYRIYGLPPGSYLVSVRGSRGFSHKPYDFNVPTYYPSSTRDTASEVLVTDGQETQDIDIRYRDEPGHRVSGIVSGIPGSVGLSYVGTGISLTNAKTGLVEATSYVQGNDPKGAFIFNGIPDGVYDLTATRTGAREDGLASSPHRITVKGADVTGLQLALGPLGKISGQLVLDPVPEGIRKEAAQTPDSSIAEILVTARREGKPDPRMPSSIPTTPDEKGLFVFGNLSLATDRLDVNLPSEDWYLRQMSSGKIDKAAERARPRQAATSSGSDIAARGVAINAGDHVAGLSIVVGRGAAYLAGAVTPVGEGSTLPAHIRLCLVPAEPERNADVLYYRQTIIGGDGKFVIANVAPGKYRAVAVPGPADDSPEGRATQIAWDGVARKQLLQRAESDGIDLELAPRKRVKDFSLKFKPVPLVH